MTFGVYWLLITSQLLWLMEVYYSLNTSSWGQWSRWKWKELCEWYWENVNEASAFCKLKRILLSWVIFGNGAWNKRLLILNFYLDMFLKIILIFQISLFAIEIYVIENFLVLKRSQWKQEMSLEAKKKSNSKVYMPHC